MYLNKKEKEWLLNKKKIVFRDLFINFTFIVMIIIGVFFELKRNNISDFLSYFALFIFGFYNFSINIDKFFNEKALLKIIEKIEKTNAEDMKNN